MTTERASTPDSVTATQDPHDPAKQMYDPPALTRYGPIVEIVRGPSTGAFDAFVGDPGGFGGS